MSIARRGRAERRHDAADSLPALAIPLRSASSSTATCAGVWGEGPLRLSCASACARPCLRPLAKPRRLQQPQEGTQPARGVEAHGLVVRCQCVQQEPQPAAFNEAPAVERHLAVHQRRGRRFRRENGAHEDGDDKRRVVARRAAGGTFTIVVLGARLQRPVHRVGV